VIPAVPAALGHEYAEANRVRLRDVRAGRGALMPLSSRPG